jgi:hypothetical protein
LFNGSKRIGAVPASTAGSRLDQHQCAAAAFMTYFQTGSVCQIRTGTFLMSIHKKILEWQAAHPNITWIGWSIVWAIVLVSLFWPSRVLR